MSVGLKDLRGLAIGVVNKTLNLSINLLGGSLTVFACARDIPAEEDVIAFLAEADHSQTAHAPFTNHSASKFGGLGDVSGGAV